MNTFMNIKARAAYKMATDGAKMSKVAASAAGGRKNTRYHTNRKVNEL